MNKELALKNLIEITDILKKYNISHWLTDGTLLGLIRENDIIDHDHDTDIGLTIENFDKTVVFELIKSGFKIENVWGDYEKVGFEIGLLKNGIMTDLFFFEKNDSGEFFHSAYVHHHGNTFRRIDYIYDVFDIKTSLFLGHNFYIPDNPVKFLITKYGKEWNIPNTKWDYAYDPRNHRKTNIFMIKNDMEEKFNKWINEK